MAERFLDWLISWQKTHARRNDFAVVKETVLNNY